MRYGGREGRVSEVRREGGEEEREVVMASQGNDRWMEGVEERERIDTPSVWLHSLLLPSMSCLKK